jgi:DNA topoisomerase-1
VKDKHKDDQIFNKINANDINKYLQSFMKDLSAKVYRTFNASNLFNKELKKIIKKYENVENKKDPVVVKDILNFYMLANLKVAKLMNHQKNVKSSSHKKTVDNVTEMINKLKKQLAKTRKKSKKNPNAIKKLKDKIKAYKSKKELVKEMKGVALGTSRENYIDPRISTAFMKTFDLPIDKIFSKALQLKFKWAFSADENFKF